MSLKLDNNRGGFSVEHNSDLDTQLSDSQIRKIKKECKYRNEYVDLLDQHLAKQNSFPSFAGLVKVNDSTLYLWTRKYPEFAAVQRKYKKRKTKLYA